MTQYDEMRQQLERLPDEDLVTILEEHDEDQWRPEVFDIVKSILSRRGVSYDNPVSDKEEEEIFDETAALDLITVAEYSNIADAETDRMALEAKGLRVWVQNRHSHYGKASLQVQSADFAIASDILQSEPVPSSDLPEDIAEPPCPKCQSRNVMEKAEIQEPSAEHPFPTQVWLYHCASCGHKWAAS